MDNDKRLYFKKPPKKYPFEKRWKMKKTREKRRKKREGKLFNVSIAKAEKYFSEKYGL